MSIVKCECCEKEFKKDLNQVKITKHNFCSRKCCFDYRNSPNILKKRFFKYIKKQPNGCWLWIGHQDKDGYGVIEIKGKTTKAHRLSWTLHNGEIPKGILVCHKCDCTSCVNPQHLFLGTYQDNMTDMVNKKRGKWISGEEHYRSKLTESKVREIRKLYKTGKYSQVELAKKYAMSSRGVFHIVNYNTWKQVEG